MRKEVLSLSATLTIAPTITLTTDNCFIVIAIILVTVIVACENYLILKFKMISRGKEDAV